MINDLRRRISIIVEDFVARQSLGVLADEFEVANLPSLYENGEPAVIASENTPQGQTRLNYIPRSNDVFTLEVNQNDNLKAGLTYAFSDAVLKPGFTLCATTVEYGLEGSLLPHIHSEAIKSVARRAARRFSL